MKTISQLREEMLKLTECDENSFIEFGRDRIGGGDSYLRIRYIATPGGMKFCFKLLKMHQGCMMEGSGVYFDDAEVCAQEALRLIDKFQWSPNAPQTVLDRRKRLAEQFGPMDFRFVFNTKTPIMFNEMRA